MDMVSALNSEASGPGSSPDRGHCVVFFGKTLYSDSATPPRCINGTSEPNAARNPAMD